METLVIGIVAILIIVVVAALAPRVGVAGPLVLVLIGIGISFLPFVPAVEVPPEVILGGVLPPLLYSSAASMPAMDFRRDFRAIGSLSVVLVVLSSVVVGLVLWLLLPDIGLPAAIALGAIVSPTDAVATSIARSLGVPSRVVAVLEGESLLNDATALVLLRAAIVAIPGSIAFGLVALQFVWSAAAAVVIGVVVGVVHLHVRRLLRHPTAGTAISFVVPFVASVPAEALGASGLVAAVAAGLVSGTGAAKYLRPQDRVADRHNWKTIELLLEGGIFLLMGLELYGLVVDLEEHGGGLAMAVLLAVVVGTTVMIVRAGFVTALLLGLDRGFRRRRAIARRRRQRAPGPSAPVRSPKRARLLASFGPVGFTPAERFVIVWAGMRGAVTLAAAQTLPANTPQQSLLVMTAFIVAAGSLIVQGATLAPLVRRLGLTGQHPDETTGERGRLHTLVRRAGLAVVEDPQLRRPDGGPFDDAVLDRARRITVARHRSSESLVAGETARAVDREQVELRLVMIAAERAALLDARSRAAYSSRILQEALDALDAEQITLELRGADPGAEGGR